MEKNGNRRLVGLATAMHFAVDGLCLCCLYLLAEQSEEVDVLSCFLTYNVLAFATQPLTGICIDHMKRPHWMLLAAVVTLCIAVGVAALTLWQDTGLSIQTTTLTVATLLGVGNSLFHVWGGKQTALQSGNDIRVLGVFVSTGAFGLAVSAVLWGWGWLCMLMLSLSLLAVVYLRSEHASVSMPTMPEDARPSPLDRKGAWTALIVLGLMAFVAMRSLLGETFSACVTKNPITVLALGLMAMLGKMAGGWVARRWGKARSLTVMVVIAFGCLAAKGTGMAAVLLGLMAINTTMPVTLCWANKALKGHEGLAFGLLAAALMPAYLLAT